MCLVGVVVRRYIDFLILLIPTPLAPALILQQHPYFLLNLKCFSFFITMEREIFQHLLEGGTEGAMWLML